MDSQKKFLKGTLSDLNATSCSKGLVRSCRKCCCPAAVRVVVRDAVGTVVKGSYKSCCRGYGRTYY